MKRCHPSQLASLLAVVAQSALACSTVGEKPTDAELFAKAHSVFLAHIVRTDEKAPRTDIFKASVSYVEGDFQVVEVLKGQPPADGKVNDLVFGPGNCSLGLLAGLDYLFFIQDEKTKMVLWPTGSRAFINREGTEAVKLLTQLRALPK